MNKGFTLIEVLLSMAILSVLLLITSDFIVSNSDFILESQVNTSLNADYNYITKRLEYDLDRATSLLTPSGIGTSSPTLNLGVGSTFTYGVVNNKLTLTDSTGAYSLNSSETKASNFNFTLLGTDSAQLMRVTGTITSLPKTRQGTASRSITIERPLR